jgi:glycosyltransferase involved in cell wall biosynthesis
VTAAFYGHCRVVLSPSAAADASLAALGVPADRIARWDRGVDTERFDPRRRVPGLLPGEVNVLYAGRLTREKGVDLLARALLAARRRDPRLHLVVAGGGPEEGLVRDALGEHVTILGWLHGDELARAYASADAFLFASRTDTFGQVVLEAQASGLPVVAVGEGGPAGLIDDGRTGLLRAASAQALAGAVVELASSGPLRRRLGEAARAAATARSWGASLARLADGYRRALEAPDARPGRRAA